ncbi:MAG: hypothetical protein SFX73_38420 [Kofleriaceae bacterium]|nr:hypothetical protein [Kofleriaceae bacterium]
MRIVILFLLALVAATRLAAAESDPPRVRVIVHPRTQVSVLDRKYVADAFLKKRSRWDDDRAILPVDQAPRSALREHFSRQLLGRPTEAVRRYWSQLVFSGRGLPPPELRSDEAVVNYVKSHPGAIGYVSANANVDGVRVVEVR